MAGLFSRFKGRALVLLVVAIPLMILLLLAAVEISRAIIVNHTLVQFTRKAGNLTARGHDVGQSLATAIAAIAPTLHDTNKQQWKVIYSQIREPSGMSCSARPCPYQVDSQVEAGELKALSTVGAVKKPVMISGVPSVEASQVFHSIEVYYDYRPELFSLVGKIIDLKFYEKTVYTDLAAVH